MLSMDLCPGGELGLVFGLKSLLAIPPGAPAIEIITDVRRADNWHVSTLGVGLGRTSIAQIF
jgi:hypothetical protein